MKHKVWISGKMDPAHNSLGYWKPEMVFHLKECECGQGDKWRLAVEKYERTTLMDPEDFIAAVLFDKIVPFDNNEKWQNPGGK